MLDIYQLIHIPTAWESDLLLRTLVILQQLKHWQIAKTGNLVNTNMLYCHALWMETRQVLKFWTQHYLFMIILQTNGLKVSPVYLYNHPSSHLGHEPGHPWVRCTINWEKSNAGPQRIGGGWLVLRNCHGFALILPHAAATSDRDSLYWGIHVQANALWWLLLQEYEEDYHQGSEHLKGFVVLVTACNLITWWSMSYSSCALVFYSEFFWCLVMKEQYMFVMIVSPSNVGPFGFKVYTTCKLEGAHSCL